VKVVLVVVCVLAISGFLYLGIGAWLRDRAERAGHWRVETVTKPGGAIEVQLVREGAEHPRVVRELPADMDPIELTSELRLAREDARLQAHELNRPD
jgi:hypothetical protein